jgi:hypothetical protein
VHSAHLDMDHLHELQSLRPLSRDALHELLSTELGSSLAYLAEALLPLGRDSLMVALLAARLLRTRRLLPELLSQDVEFRRTVLEGYREEVLGNIRSSVEPALAQRALEVVAAIQPLPRSPNDLDEAIATFLGVTPSALRLALAAFVDAGVLKQEVDMLRITPDVLGDYVLANKMVALGHNSGFDLELIAALGDRVLVNVVRNVAELDWQLSEAGTPAHLFDASWDRLTDAFRGASNSGRVSLLGRLTAVGRYQPTRLLALAEWLMAHPEGDDAADPESLFGIRTSNEEVIQALPPLLATVALHEDTVDDALDILWEIGREDARAPTRHTNHAMRHLEQFATYSFWKPAWVQDRSLDAAERWIRTPGWSTGVNSPLGMVKQVFGMSVIEERFDEATSALLLTRYPVNPDATRDVRLRAIAILERLAMSADARGRHLALKALLHALERPDRSYGHVVSQGEEQRFREQYDAALVSLTRVVNSSPTPLMRVRIKLELRRKARHTLVPGLGAAMIALYDSISETSDTERVRAIGNGMTDFGPGESWETRRDALQQLRGRVVDSLANSTAADDAWQALDVTCADFDAAGEGYTAGYVLWDLTTRYPSVGGAILARLLMRAENGDVIRADWLPSLLAPFRDMDHAYFQATLTRAGASDHWSVRRGAALSLNRNLAVVEWTAAETAVIRALLADDSGEVRSAAVAALSATSAATAATLLGDIRVGADVEIAKHVGNLWENRGSDDAPILTEDTARGLLTQLVEVRDLGSAQYELSSFLATTSRQFPGLVVDFLIDRVTREFSSLDESDFTYADRYDAIPYDGFAGIQEGLRDSGLYETVLERILRTVQEIPSDEWQLREKMSQLFDVIGDWDPRFEDVLLGWARSRDCDRLGSAALLFEHLRRDFVLSARSFVEELFVTSANCSEAIRARLADGLERGALRSSSVGLHIGEIDPVQSQLATHGASIAAEIRAAGASAEVAELYERIAVSAQGAVDRAVRRGREWAAGRSN